MILDVNVHAENLFVFGSRWAHAAGHWDLVCGPAKHEPSSCRKCSLLATSTKEGISRIKVQLLAKVHEEVIGIWAYVPGVSLVCRSGAYD